MTKTIVLLNEQHSLMPDQERILNEKYGKDWEIMPIPKDGWTADQMKNATKDIINMYDDGDVVFASPVPYLIKLLVGELGGFVKIFHNDHREKKELPNGKIIMVVAQTGWQLL